MLAYLAGPDVFLPDGKDLLAAKQAICAEAGMTGLSPLDSDAGPDAASIFANCEATMDRANLILANMTPFRGPGMDAGTAYEVGYMRAQGKPVFAYANTPLAYADRVPGSRVAEDGKRIDADGIDIEDFGRAENLMLACAAERFGHAIFSPAAAVDPFRNLEAFRMAVRAAARVATPT